MAVLRDQGKPARTRYATLEEFGARDKAFASLLECRLETGRTHQIRVHLAMIRHPVVGDGPYGGGAAAARRFGAAAAIPAVEALGRHALDAYRLGFEHPATGERLEFVKEMPSFMSSLAACLEAV
jgi:23S rRNA pseudouridine1911/1915/1917 synthase